MEHVRLTSAALLPLLVRPVLLNTLPTGVDVTAAYPTASAVPLPPTTLATPSAQALPTASL